MGFMVMFALLLMSCSQEDQSSTKDDSNTQSVDLKFGTLLNDLANRAMSVNKNHFAQVPDCSDAVPAVASIEFSYGGNDYDIDVDILSDGTTYFTDYTEELKIAVPNNDQVIVTLTGFRVYDGDPDDGGNLIWLAPIESTPGEFDGYIDNPLPFDFVVRDGTKPYIDVEVLCFDRRMVNEYGYPFFDLVPGKLYPLCFFANYCTESGRHYVGNYSVALYYDNGMERIPLYNSAQTPTTGITGGEYFADPLCLVVPESPFEDSTRDYLFYVVTPLDWTGSYGDINNVPLPEVGLSWDDVDGYLNDDGESVDYIHLFIGCGDVPGGGDDCIADDDNDGICDDVDDCVNGVGAGCDTTNDCPPTADDTNGDCISDVTQCELFPQLCEEEGNENCETAFAQGDTRFSAIYDGNGNGRWGWIAQGEGTYTIYAAAGNQYKTDMPVGTATVSIVGDNVQVKIDEASGYNFTELHIDLFSDIPSYNEVKAPGQYSYNEGEVIGDQGTFVYANPAGDNSFYIVIHAVSCDE